MTLIIRTPISLVPSICSCSNLGAHGHNGHIFFPHLYNKEIVYTVVCVGVKEFFIVKLNSIKNWYVISLPISKYCTFYIKWVSGHVVVLAYCTWWAQIPRSSNCHLSCSYRLEYIDTCLFWRFGEIWWEIVPSSNSTISYMFRCCTIV